MNRRRFLKEMAASTALALASASATAVERAEDKGSEFCFCVMSDPHCSDRPTPGLEKYGSGLDRFLLALRFAEELNADDRPDFVLLLGDIHPFALKERISDIHIPVHPTPGNHESDKEKRQLLRALFPNDFRVNGTESDYYSFVHKGVRFISICDAGAGGDHVGHLCSEIIEPSGQCEWIEKELTAPESRKILFAHIPLERDGQDRDMHLSRNDSRWLKDQIVATKPAAAFFGHLHHPTEEYAIGITRLFQVRSCSWNFNKAPIGFLHIRVTSDGLNVREIVTAEYA